jgi:transcriptional regulator with PAS, ATPase and Fis domain
MRGETIKQAPGSRSVSRKERELYVCLAHPYVAQGERSQSCCPVGSGIQVGRDPSHPRHLCIDEGTVSRVHFTIVPDDHGWVIADEGSSNGTLLNGQRVGRSRVYAQDVIRAGNAVMVLTSNPPQELLWLARYGLIASSHAMARAAEAAMSTVRDDRNVLILGETGTGKEMFARLIHQASERSGEFVAVNCAAIPEHLMESTLFGSVKGAFTGADEDRIGLFRQAHQGTLLLDEIGELTPALQVKLLRTLEERCVLPVGATKAIPFDVKILAATNQVEGLESGSSRFRQDLLARLEDVVIYLPPLRERREEIMLLLYNLLDRPPAANTFSPDFVEAVLLHTWPRNTRQLLKVVRQAMRVRRDEEGLSTADVPDGLSWSSPPTGGALDPQIPPPSGSAGLPRAGAAPAGTDDNKPRRLGPPPRDLFEAIVRQHHFNVSAIARHLACDRKQVYRWLEHYGLERDS